MNVIPIYWKDSGITRIETRVIRAVSTDRGLETGAQSKWEIILEDSPFYPGGGGQAPDRGTIQGLPVSAIKKSTEGNVHSIEGGVSFEEGFAVTCIVDRDFRRDSMQQHTGQHLISAALAQMGYETVSVHLGQDYCGIEIGESDAVIEDLEAVEEKSNLWIRDNRQVRSLILTPEEAKALKLRRPLSEKADAAVQKDAPVRIVEIDGVDAVGCGGVHLQETQSAVGVMFLGLERIRGRVRTKWLIGDRIIKKAARLTALEAHLTATLSTESSLLEDRFDAFHSEAVAAKKNLTKAEMDIGRLICEKESAERNWICSEIGGGSDRMMGALSAAQENGLDAAVFFSDADGEGSRLWGCYVSEQKDAVYKEIKTRFVDSFGGKGGGKPPIRRGMIKNVPKKFFADLSEFLEKMV